MRSTDDCFLCDDLRLAGASQAGPQGRGLRGELCGSGGESKGSRLEGGGDALNTPQYFQL